MPPLWLLSLLATVAHAQFGEIASLATSFLGPALGGAGAGAQGLGQIGQLYQLAQTGIGLSGTAVEILNKASQGNWFPAAIEQVSQMQKNFGGLGPLGQAGASGGLGGLGGLGALGGLGGGVSGGGSEIGTEFGKSFPAPSVEDYLDTDEDKKTTPQSLVPFPEKTTQSSIAKKSITLFPDENIDELTSVEPSPAVPAPKKKITISLPKENPDYFEAKSTDSESEVIFTTNPKKDEDESLLSGSSSSKERVTRSEKSKILDLDKLVEVLSKNNLKNTEIKEIIDQVESNMVIPEGISNKEDGGSSVRNISPEMFEKQQRIIKAVRDLREHVDKEQKERDRLLLGPLPEPSTTVSLPTTSPDTPYPSPTFPPSTPPPRPTDPPPTLSPIVDPFSHLHHHHSFLPQPPPLTPPPQYPLYFVSGQAVPPVQVVHPQAPQVPIYPTNGYPTQQIPLSAPIQTVPLPAPHHGVLPQAPPASAHYYTYQNANANSVFRGTIQQPQFMYGMPTHQIHPTTQQPRLVQNQVAAATPFERVRLVRHDSPSAEMSNVSRRTTVPPPRHSGDLIAPTPVEGPASEQVVRLGTRPRQQQNQMSSAVQRRFVAAGASAPSRSEGTSGAHARRQHRPVTPVQPAKRETSIDYHLNSAAKAQAAMMHRIHAVPMRSSPVPPRKFPTRTAKTLRLTTPPTSPSRAISPTRVISFDANRPVGERTKVTPFWIPSTFIRRYPQRYAGEPLMGDYDLLKNRLEESARSRVGQLLVLPSDIPVDGQLFINSAPIDSIESEENPHFPSPQPFPFWPSPFHTSPSPSFPTPSSFGFTRSPFRSTQVFRSTAFPRRVRPRKRRLNNQRRNGMSRRRKQGLSRPSDNISASDNVAYIFYKFTVKEGDRLAMHPMDCGTKNIVNVAGEYHNEPNKKVSCEKAVAISFNRADEINVSSDKDIFVEFYRQSTLFASRRYVTCFRWFITAPITIVSVLIVFAYGLLKCKRLKWEKEVDVMKRKEEMEEQSAGAPDEEEQGGEQSVMQISARIPSLREDQGADESDSNKNEDKKKKNKKKKKKEKEKDQSVKKSDKEKKEGEEQKPKTIEDIDLEKTQKETMVKPKKMVVEEAPPPKSVYMK